MRRPQLLKATLDSLTLASKPARYCGLWLVENNWVSQTQAIEMGFMRGLTYQYRYCPQPNKSAALNLVLDEIHTGLIVFIDDDVRLDSQCLLAYANAARRYGRGYFFGGPTTADYEIPPPFWLRNFLPPSGRGLQYSARETCVLQRQKTPFLGFNWAAYAQDLRSAGGFDPSFGPGSATGRRGQETEMQRRLYREGAAPVYVPMACVRHHVPGRNCTMGWILQRSYYHGLTEGAWAARSSSRLLRYVKLAKVLAFHRALQAVRPLKYVLHGRSVRQFAAQHHRERCRGLTDGYRNPN